jgi:hypothetical protein
MLVRGSFSLFYPGVSGGRDERMLRDNKYQKDIYNVKAHRLQDVGDKREYKGEKGNEMRPLWQGARAIISVPAHSLQRC